MAKHLVLNVLQNVLSDFLEIDEKNFDLNLAVWSGSIVLKDVKVKTDKLFRSFNLSFVNGVVKTLEVKIPWTALLTSSVHIDIDGLYLQVCPLNVSTLDKEQTRKRLAIMKQEKIDFADKFIDFNKGGHDGEIHGEDDDDSEDSDEDEEVRAEKRRQRRQAKKDAHKSWIEIWTSKIVDNLEISLKNIHVRYEDDHALNGSTYSAGVTLSSFLLTTCDANWNTSFVARHDEPIRKLCKVENFGAYWNMQSQSLAGLSDKDWQQAMHDIIFRNEDFRHGDHEDSVDIAKKVAFMQAQAQADGRQHNPGSMKYMVAPTNKLVIKVLHNDHLANPGDTPKYDVSIVNEQLDLSVDGLQYKQLNQTLEMIGLVEAMKQPYMYRPTCRPMGREGCRVWWKYACKLAIKRPRYIRLVKLSKMVNPRNQFESLLTSDDKVEMEVLEERLSLQTIIVFRHAAAEEMALEAEAERKDARRRLKEAGGGAARGQKGGGAGGKVAQSRTWWGFFKGEPKPGERVKQQQPDRAGISNNDGEVFGTWADYGDSDDEGGGRGSQGSKSGGDDSQNVEDGDIAISNILEGLREDNKRRIEKNRSHNTLLALTLESSAKLELSQYGVPVLSASMALSSTARVTHLGLHVVLDLGDMVAVDRITPTPPLPNLISVKDTHEGAETRQALLEGEGTWKSSSSSSTSSTTGDGDGPQAQVVRPSFTVIFTRSNDNKSVVKIASLPLEFALNKLCVQHIIGIFFYPKPPPPGKSAEDEAALSRRRRQQAREALMKATSGIGGASGAPDGDSVGEGGDEGERQKPAAAAQEHNLELIFEAHAPKIIIPEDSSSDRGYLLLDTGFLKVHGFIGSNGMSWDLRLQNINAGMPLHASDMYSLEDLEELYLIKPFDIGCQIQNTDKAEADMNVAVSFEPEFRGELSARKLERLLHSLGVASATLFQKPSFDGVVAMKALRALDKEPHYVKAREALAAEQAQAQARANAFAAASSSADSLGDREGGVPPSPGPDGSGSGGAEVRPGSPVGPAQSAGYSMRARQNEYGNELVEGGNQVEIKSLIQGMDDTEEEQEVKSRDPLLAGLRLTINIPRVALDLSYDDKGHHAVFEVYQLEALLVNRPHDLCVELNFGGLSIQDNMRTESQCYLASTPLTAAAAESGSGKDKDRANSKRSSHKFVHIQYVNIQNRLSPYFKAHGAELSVEFANLHLNVDVMTVMHLRPFIIVLLHNKAKEQKQDGSQGPARADGPPPGTVVDNSNIPVTQKPFGMHMAFTMKTLRLDIMRVGEESMEESNAPASAPTLASATLKLDPTFSLQISDLRADIDNRGLMRAEVHLRSVEIVDIRRLSRDYALKKVFGPMTEIIGGGAHEGRGEGGQGPQKEGAEEVQDIIKLWFNQESSEQSQLEVLVSNASTYASTDTFLDLSNVALGNFQAFIALLSAPPPVTSTLGSARSSQADLSLSEGGAGTSEAGGVFRDSEGVGAGEESCFVDVPDSGKYRLEQGYDKSPPPAPSRSDEKEKEKDTDKEQEQGQRALSAGGGRDSDDAGAGRPIGSQPARQTMVIKATVKNPRLCLLDDPTSEASPAIVATCGLELLQTRDMRIDEWLDKRDLRESLHMSIRNLEVFTLRSLADRNPRAILQPMGIEFNMRRETFNGQLLSSSISVDTDNALARVTLKDLVLAKSVFTRSSTSDDIQQKQANEALVQQYQMHHLQQQSEYQLRVEPLQVNNSSLTNHTFTFNLGQVALVAMNDFQGQNTPVLRMQLDESKFCIARGQGLLFGDGDFYASADFYNPRLNIWEPILDRWHPSLQIVTEAGETQYNMKSELTMQVTVSGIMLETLMQSYSLLVSLTREEEDVVEKEERHAASEVVIANELGSPIDISVFESSSNSQLMTLRHGESGELRRVGDSMKRASPSAATGVPSSVDIQFMGSFAQQRVGLKNLPVTIPRTRMYHLMPKLSKQSEEDLAGETTSARTRQLSGQGTPSADVRPEVHRMVLIEPIEEETYEYARYEPLTSRWVAPFLAGDPHEWSDADGRDKRPIDSVSLGSDRWEWQYPKWKKCVRGEIGVEIDEDGWEYSTSFHNFSITSKPRAYQNLDSCRRRRWINARVPRVGSQADKQRPLNVHWDVQVQNDGTKLATLRSGLQLRNDLPYPVEIILSYVSWDSDQQLGPIEEGQTFNVPLLCSYATSMQIKPAHVPYAWSESIPCAIQTHDYSDSLDLRCESTSLTPLCVQAMVVQEAKSVLVTLNPYIVIQNRLPCDVKFRMGYSSKDARQESGEVKCGETFKLAYMDCSARPQVSISLGEQREWSRPVALETGLEGRGGRSGSLLSRERSSTNGSKSNSSSEKEGSDDMRGLRLIELPHSHPMRNNDGVDNGVVVAMKVSVTNNVMVELFSKYLLIDQTGLGLCVLTNKRYGVEMLRYTSFQAAGAGAGAVAAVGAGASGKRAGGEGLEAPRVKEQEPVRRASGGGSTGEEVWKDSRSPMKAEEDRVSALVSDFYVDSEADYTPTTVNMNDFVYTDRKYRWTYLPEDLRGAVCIRTACGDKLRRSRKMMSFRATKPSFLVVLADSRKQMKWLREDGFQEIVGHAIAMRVFHGSTQEVYYTIHGKYLEQDELAELRGNYSKVITVMYSVFVLEAPPEPLPSAVDGAHQQFSGVGGVLSQIQFHNTYNRSVPNRCWVDGGEGLAMFYTGDDSMKIGIPKGTDLPRGRARTKSAQPGRRQSVAAPKRDLKRGDSHYSEEIRISMTRVQHSDSFEVVDWDSRASYQLAYRMRLMPGLFRYTQEVVIVPQFCVVNLMEEEIMLRQSGTKTETVYYPYQPAGWHKTDYDFDCSVQIGCKSSLFSLGMLDLNEVGSSTLLVQRRDDSSDGDKAIVLHVEVKVARPEERCGVVVVVWRSTSDNYSTMMINNETDLPITVMQDIRQKYKMLFEKNKNYKNLFQICVAPHSSVPFGWADPEMEGVVNVAIGTSIDHEDSSQRIVSLNMLRTGYEMRLSDGVMKKDKSSFNEVVFSVKAINGTRVLQCSRPTKTHITTPSRRLSSAQNMSSGVVGALGGPGSPGKRGAPVPPPVPEPAVSSTSVNFSLASFGISLVVEKPVRRELMSLYVDGLFARYGNHTGRRQSFVELSVANAQVDNYSESVIHPVLLYDLRDNQADDSGGSGGSGGNGPNIEEIPLLKLTLITESPLPSKDGTGTMSIVKYIGARLMPMAFQVDSATIQLLYTDLLNDLKYVTREQSVASSAPGRYMNDRNLFLIGAESDAMVDVYESKTLVQLSKMYIEHMELHPMKFRVTFVQTPFPRRGSMNVTLHSTFMNIVTSLAGIEKVELRLKSFNVKDALESVQSLRSAVVQKTWQDIKGQLGSVLGSMAALGSPLGFAKKIGGGVTDLFYEPYQGAMHSPVEFVSGVGKGTASLASNVVGGVFSSVGSIAGTASKGIGYLSGDGDYVRRRALKKQRLRAQGGGFFDGLMDGGDSLVSGVSSGLSGLVTRPVEEAQKGGAKGFIKGVGLGILGAVVKPIMGVTDAVTGLATGISNQVTNETVAVQVRPVRAMLRSESDSNVLVIGPMNVKAADAQEMILQRAKNLKYDDLFLDFVILQEAKEECVILTETYVFWKQSNEKLWGRVWANVSHVLFYGRTVGIHLYTSASSKGASKVVEIPCRSRELALVLYETLARNAFRMGNPSNVTPFVSVQQQARTLSDEDFRRLTLADPARPFTLDNMLDGYLFGSNNDPRANSNERPLSEPKLKAWLTQEMLKPVVNWASLDKIVWRFVCIWDAAHRGIQASRLCLLTIVNRSDSPVQISRLALDYGKAVALYGSMATGYETESRCIMPGGAAIVFACAHHPSPIEVGHLKAVIDCPSFTATVASTQRESSCESKGAFLAGFLEKSVSEWYAKYCLVIS